MSQLNSQRNDGRLNSQEDGIRIRVFVISLLFTHAMLVVWQNSHNSPNLDEVGHLSAGIAVYKFGRFDLYRVNPPLVKSIAALPAVLGGAETDWQSYYLSDFGRPEWAVGNGFIEANGGGWFRWFRYARYAVLPLSLIGGLVCYKWSRELYGASSGFLSLTLWCFSPNVLTWGASITPDMGATSLALLACWRFWHWMRSPSYANAFLAGITLGLAELAKMTWVILFVLWPLAWLGWKAVNRNTDSPEHREPCRGEFRQLLVILILGLYVLNLGYAFDGSFQRIGDYKFGTRLLAGNQSKVDRGPGGNRFQGTWLEHLPVPLPREYLRGMDLQWIDFEEKKPSYLNGEWKKGGWWHYYLEVVLLKVPLGYWLIGFCTIYATLFSHPYRAKWRDEIILLLPALAVFVLVSSQTGFSRYLRYVLPAFPFVFIWCGKLAQSWEFKQRTLSILCSIGLLWGTASSLWVFPHSMSYFNELAGGPHGGHRYLLDANIDWGQDLFYFKDWYDAHPEARPIKTDFYSFVDENNIGIEKFQGDFEQMEWYAISVHRLFGQSGTYEFLWKHHEPFAKAGYSIWIYHVPRSDSSDNN